MEKLTIPKFENEADEANWAYEHREELAKTFITQYRLGQEGRSSRIELKMLDALQTKELLIASEELDESGLVETLREKLKSK